MTAMKVPIPRLPRLIRFGMVAVVATIIFYYSIITVPETPPQAGPLWDKQLHFAAYATLTITLAYATLGNRDQPWSRAGTVIILAMAFGLLVELLQGFVDYRYTSWLDFVANIIGIAMGSLWFGIESRFKYVRIPRKISNNS